MSCAINDGGPAFPQTAFLNANNEVAVAGQYFAEASGMTLRDYFAAMAMQGIVDRILFNQHLENQFVRECRTDRDREERAAQLPAFCASIAFDVADAMLAEREKKGAS